MQDPGDKDQALLAISSLSDLVVVNIAGAAEMEPVLFTEENLQAILAETPEQLFVEGLPPGEFKKLARERIDRAVQSALALRAGLRTAYVADLAATVRDFLSRLDQVLQLLRCYVLQNARAGLSGLDRELQDLIVQLADSSFERGDNVRCMDDLQHQIVPALKKLLWVFRK
jgi:hypothetical protein